MYFLVEQPNRISLEVLEASWQQPVPIGFFLLLIYDHLHHQNLKDLQLFVLVPIALMAQLLLLQLAQIMQYHHLLQTALPVLSMASLLHYSHRASSPFSLQLVLGSISLHALPVFVLFFLICVGF